ncbi:hypothetical protein VB773_10990 [Haloarculaceae archaeon H-GB2-1]|nr:hypothetical protein [Haloarculaceae archaeon H-GB1-1]MEA5386517.1 hypothetical protein [Haloarculaceae archaeon H-GB11]MEA5408031.1 hypothetical protein [Haloarculaceae archaeon H-GB2-1]
MARPTGDLHLLTIATIFVVVFALMWAGVQHSRGQLITDDGLDEREAALQTAIWDEIDRTRATRGLEPTTRRPRITGDAQTVARAFAAGNVSAGPMGTEEAANVTANLTRPNLCSQVLVNADRRPTESLSNRVLDRLVATDDEAVLFRNPSFLSGLGVVVHQHEVYVVYRSCAQRRLSP